MQGCSPEPPVGSVTIPIPRHSEIGPGLTEAIFSSANRNWATGTGAVPEAQQALMIHQAFAMAAEWEWAGPIFLFNWQDSADGAFGLHHQDGTPKLAVQAVTQLSAA